ncbi:hypothetical protein J2S03_003391 [Alicyclobacillus cycloheptanicus]|uniref:Uncharacterized protein n=1 Tax=Alicyclobacillus cycloheptanicus TaxID=1457 RepID=A0ABT9XML1_9BACL|nr:hypothetical protein [Alicyclobacillus cycloheptanicus]
MLQVSSPFPGVFRLVSHRSFISLVRYMASSGLQIIHSSSVHVE